MGWLGASAVIFDEVGFHDKLAESLFLPFFFCKIEEVLGLSALSNILLRSEAEVRRLEVPLAWSSLELIFFHGDYLHSFTHSPHSPTTLCFFTGPRNSNSRERHVPSYPALPHLHQQPPRAAMGAIIDPIRDGKEYTMPFLLALQKRATLREESHDVIQQDGKRREIDLICLDDG